ncbi:MAG TPA: hypothetical protein VKU41_30650 [Polyangiaceae bacterium]|nr:hypothetical protein [Polyangiaceae bacterium]
MSARGRAGKIALVAWFVAMVAVGSGLLAKHVLALPAPAVSPKLAASLDALRGPHAQSTWLAVHVLYSECRCSQRIVDHLVSTERPVGWSEIVLWVGNLAPRAELEQRFDVRRVRSADLAAYGIEAAPLLVVVDPAGHVRYAGGYTTRKQGPVIDDLRIFDDSRREAVVASLPVFGCAVSDRLKRALAVLPTP